MKKEYNYHLFLRHPETGHCKVQTIVVTNDGYMDCNLLFRKLTHNTEVFEAGYSLIGLNVGQVVNLED